LDSIIHGGYSTSLALDSSGKVHICHDDYTNHVLKYVNFDPAGLPPPAPLPSPPPIPPPNPSPSTISPVPSPIGMIYTVGSSARVGTSCSLALDSNDNPSISYFDCANGHLKYASWTGSSWNAITIDYAGYAVEYINPRPIWVTSPALNENDRACISYFDESNYRLKYFAANTSFSTIGPLPSPSPSPSSTSNFSFSSTSTGSSNYQASSVPQQSPSTSPSPAPESAPQPDSTSQSAGTHASTFPIVTATAGATTGIFAAATALFLKKRRR
jgi:hypothetical protein